MSNVLSPELRLNAAGNVVMRKPGERRFRIRFYLRPSYVEEFQAQNPGKKLPEKTEEFTGTLKEAKNRAFSALMNLDSAVSIKLAYEITGEYAKGWKVVK